MTNLTTWKIWADTGGTFTDCLALSPQGSLQRVKVLSNSNLRGEVRGLSPTGMPRIAAPWTVYGELFAGYLFRLLGSDFKARVLRLEGETLLLEKPLPANHGREFALSAGEEAPILAARLLTRTPLSKPLPEADLRLGSTKGTNALLERKTAKVVLLTTQGFGDLLTIRDQQRPDIFALDIVKPLPLFERVIEVPERISAQGEVLQPIDEGWLDALPGLLQGAESIAIVLLNAYANPLHEELLAERLRAAGLEPISCSNAIAPGIRLLPRAQTTVVNAALAPVIARYLDGIAQKVSGSLRVMTSAGSLVANKFFLPKDSLLSGPAGGVVGAATIAQRAGFSRIISFDMGGTSTDVARYDEAFDLTYELKVGDAHLLSPALAIHTVAAGGGSLCQYDGYRLQVGPESAGAAPGPACYGAGGSLAITDVNLLLGRIDAGRFGLPLSRAAAQKALAELQARMETAAQADVLLQGLLEIANEKMAEAIRHISVRKGYDPKTYALVAFGGAGGQHACAVARLLEIAQVLVPYDASLLSAWGMGQADISRLAQAQVLKPLPQVTAELPALVARLEAEALAALAEEGLAEEAAVITKRSLFLRFAGQQHALEIGYETEWEQAFRQQYTLLYGHYAEGRAIELESVRVQATARRAEDPSSHKEHTQAYSVQATDSQHAFVGGKWQMLPVFDWDTLKQGSTWEGPALLASQFTTVVIEPGWQARLDARQNLLMRYTASADGVHSAQQASPEPVALGLFTNRFSAIAEEMGALLQRTAFSVNVKERMDFSCALLDAEGGLVVNAPHIPVHLGSMGHCVKALHKRFPLQPGDVLVTNHPAYGGSHLPDVTLVSPVFDAQGRRLAYLAARAHHAEIGGKAPGSMPADAHCLAEEGVVIAPQYLVRQGEPQWDQIAQVLQSGPYPTRNLAENLADLNAALAALEAGKSQLLALAAQHGADTVAHYMKQLQDYAAAMMKSRIAELPETRQFAEELLDCGARLCVSVSKKENGLHIDFSGTHSLHSGNFNATPAIVSSAVIYVLRLLLNRPLPLNEGLMHAVELHLPVCMLNPDFPDDPMQCPAVVGGNTETSQRLVDTLLKAFGLAACSQGSMNNFLFGNAHFGYYETIGGGTGAGPGFCGADAVHQHMTNTRMTDPEVMELHYPVRVHKFAVRLGSGGKGQWQGGNGIVREVEFLQAMTVTLLTQHRHERPYGMEGGEPGACGEQYLLRANQPSKTLDGICAFEVQPGDRVRILTPGGGGWGKVALAGK